MSTLRQLLGDSAPIAAVREQAARLLRSASSPGRRLPPVLILGETGTGKGLLAAALHRASGRGAGPFVDVNCAAIPESLLEAELFGFERGAFTDARQAKAGLFQTAGGGAIFLDEVGLLPLALQAKLLKVIEERSVRRLGSTRSEPLDASVIAATSEDLAAAVRDGRFRADLYHRLAVVTLVLPPLRARGRDVVVLAQHFLARVCKDYGMPARSLGDDAQAAMLAYAWPGNVRELANALERAVLLSEDLVLTAGDLGLPAPMDARPATHAASGPTVAAAGGMASEGGGSASAGGGSASAGAQAPDMAAASERSVLLEVLRAAGWNFTRAATRLGLPRNTLRYRVERLGLTPEGPPWRRRGGRPPAAAWPAGLADARASPGIMAPPRTSPPLEPPGPVASPAPPAPGRAPRAAPTPSRVTLLLVRLLPAGPGGRGVSRALDECAVKVRGFGGRVEELGPGELLAAFGLEPDDEAPRRASYAALAMRTLAARARSNAPELPTIKLALHTELLAVTRNGDTLRLDPGDCAGVRRSLDALLDGVGTGSVVASAAASRFLVRRFDLVPLEGALGPSAGACRIIRPSGPGHTRFVGRERELRLLRECFGLAEAGQGQVVTLVGEPGIGKSRLLRELRRRLDRSATWVEGQALSFGRSMPFHPVIDMLRRVARIDDADPEPEVAAKIERMVTRLGPDVGATLPFVRYLLSVDPGDAAVLAMDPRRRHAAIVGATHLLLERGAELRPHVVVLEDLHWCDPATEDWIAKLAEGIAAKRVLVVMTHRPGYRLALGSGAVHTALALSTLSNEDSLRIARSLLGLDDLPPALQGLLVDKAEGNPFFIEELVRSLQEMGAVPPSGQGRIPTAPLGRVAVPDTVEEVILARTHRLDEPLRKLLEVAAVIGRTVAFPLLRAVTGRPEEALAHDLHRLQAAEFLRETRVFPEVEHTFKHALTQDVAYGRVPSDERRALHGHIARTIEHLYPDRLGEHVERLAYHALRGEQWDAAVRYSREAGAKAFARSANREAVVSFEQALAALEHVAESPDTLAGAIDIRLTLRSALLQLGELRQITRHLREAEALATALSDRRRMAWVWTYMTITHLFAGEPEEALAIGERALEVAEHVGDVGLRASARTPLAHACRELGDFRRAILLFGQTIDALSGDLIRERLGQGMPPSFYARSMATFCLAEVGGFSEAARLGTEAASLTETLDLPFGLALARVALGHTYMVQGRLPDAIERLDAALALIEGRGLPTWFPWAAALKGHALALSGRAAEGLTLLERAIERAEALPFLVGHSQWVAWRAHARGVTGRVDEARRGGEEALRLGRQRGERGYQAWILHVLGEIEARCGPEAAPAAEGWYRQALALATELGMRPLVARCHQGLGSLPRAADGAGREHLAAARALFAELGMPAGPAGPGPPGAPVV